MQSGSGYDQDMLAHSMPSDKWFRSRGLAKLGIDMEIHLRAFSVNAVFQHLKTASKKVYVTVDEFHDLLRSDRTTSEVLSVFEHRLIETFQNAQGEIK
ncbi:unnamed protein product [Gongylonema pulchrum]|uniref:Guanylate cyclase domain-containing protein n=1 Tax=Gongylonema pulchrum TaxID=637853 RepID=A0A183CUT7_9BILA|nr:unnamed protein product [Gongylonema pulchrum]